MNANEYFQGKELELYEDLVDTLVIAFDEHFRKMAALVDKDSSFDIIAHAFGTAFLTMLCTTLHPSSREIFIKDFCEDALESVRLVKEQRLDEIEPPKRVLN